MGLVTLESGGIKTLSLELIEEARVVRGIIVVATFLLVFNNCVDLDARLGINGLRTNVDDFEKEDSSGVTRRVVFKVAGFVGLADAAAAVDAAAAAVDARASVTVFGTRVVRGLISEKEVARDLEGNLFSSNPASCE